MYRIVQYHPRAGIRGACYLIDSSNQIIKVLSSNNISLWGVAGYQIDPAIYSVIDQNEDINKLIEKYLIELL